MEIVFLLVPLILLALGFPIYIIFLAASAVALTLVVRVPATVMVQTMFGSLDVFPLIAVPFFIFFGEIIARGGISKRLINWFLSLFGGLPGSLALATLGATEVFSAMSGASSAATAAIGRTMYPALLAGGYRQWFAAGLMTSVGSIDVVIPPSIAMILYGASAQESVALLYLAGFVPGILIGAFLALYIVFHALRNRVPVTSGFQWPTFLRSTRQVLWSLGAPLLILGGIYSGIFTPTEAAGMAVVYAMVVSVALHRDLKVKDIWQIAANSAILTAQIMVIVAASGVFSWLLTVSGIPQAIIAWINSLAVPPWAVMLMINLFLLLVGALIDPTSAILVLTPLLLPIARAIGFDPIHFGIIMAVNLAIGMYTPPFGLNIFVMQALFGLPVRRIVPGIVPFFLINVGALMLITYIPEISLFLVRIRQ
ncbi:MAG: TRAP transporter large permease [Deltaproteobacteria bacterium]|nr:TRAP transporter large permease [Deltaproteobacteria bacterium]